MANFFCVIYVGSPLLAHWTSLLVIHSSMSSPSWLGIMSSLASHMDECALKSPAIIWFGPRFKQAVSVSAENAGRPCGRVESGGLHMFVRMNVWPYQTILTTKTSEHRSLGAISASILSYLIPASLRIRLATPPASTQKNKNCLSSLFYHHLVD